MTEAESHTLAGKIAALSPNESAEFDRSLIAIKAERARRTEERLAELRAKDDWELVADICQIARPDPGEVLGIRRDGGFVRGGPLLAMLRDAYRWGFRASGEGWNYEHQGPLVEQDEAFVRKMETDLASFSVRA